MLLSSGSSASLPHLRFLDYAPDGGLAPHVDLARRADGDGAKSTHTFCLYLTDTDGGETVLLKAHNDPEALAEVEPRRGRLFVFEHVCPHMARPAATPKRLLRGDLLFVGDGAASRGDDPDALEPPEPPPRCMEQHVPPPAVATAAPILRYFPAA